MSIESRFGLVVRRYVGKRKDFGSIPLRFSVRYRFGFPFSSNRLWSVYTYLENPADPPFHPWSGVGQSIASHVAGTNCPVCIVCMYSVSVARASGPSERLLGLTSAETTLCPLGTGQKGARVSGTFELLVPSAPARKDRRDRHTTIARTLRR